MQNLNYAKLPKLIVLGLIFLSLVLVGCSGTPYFNTWFNLERNYDYGMRSWQIRHDTALKDTHWVTDSEKVCFKKVVTKGKKIQEQWPDHLDYAPKVLYKMGMAQLHLANWNECLQVFEQLQANFPDFDSTKAAEYHRITCLEKKGDIALARYALQQIVAKTDHPYYEQALNHLAKLEGSDGRDSSSLVALEALFKQSSKSSILIGQAHFQAAQLYEKSQKWEMARHHYRDTSISLLSVHWQYVAHLRAALCRVNLKDTLGALDDLDSLENQKTFKDSMVNTQFTSAQLRLNGLGVQKALATLQKIAKDFPHQNNASQAWYLMGEYEREKTFFYEHALADYDSSNIAQPHSPWAGLSRQRASGLRTILSQRQKSSNNPELTLQASEAYLFQLDQPDSSIKLLHQIQSDTSAKADLRMKALYGEAFLQASARKDSLSADTLYNNLIKQFPGTEYAKQAQRNLGYEVNILTPEDSAHQLYSRADSLAEIHQGLLAIQDLDTLRSKYPKSTLAPRSQWLKASILASDLNRVEDAKIVLKALILDFPTSDYVPWARDNLDGKLELSPSDLPGQKDLLVILQKNLQNIRDEKERMEKLKAQLNKDKPEQGKEELLWDYNERYDP